MYIPSFSSSFPVLRLLQFHAFQELAAILKFNKKTTDHLKREGFYVPRLLHSLRSLKLHLPIAGFHCHTIIKTIQQIKSRIKEVKEDEQSSSLAKIQVCAIFLAGDIRRNVLPKFIRLCMETPCLCPSEGHKYGGRKLTKTDVIEFAIKSL